MAHLLLNHHLEPTKPIAVKPGAIIRMALTKCGDRHVDNPFGGSIGVRDLICFLTGTTAMQNLYFFPSPACSGRQRKIRER